MVEENPQTEAVASVETERAAPITSRFLFVDVAAQRAKQLRRGAVPRLDRSAVSHGPHKLERIAMEEVRTGVIHYTLPTNYEGSPRSLNRDDAAGTR
jgi:DNA-directed RNA polymerase subunit K/omega